MPPCRQRAGPALLREPMTFGPTVAAAGVVEGGAIREEGLARAVLLRRRPRSVGCGRGRGSCGSSRLNGNKGQGQGGGGG